MTTLSDLDYELSAGGVTLLFGNENPVGVVSDTLDDATGVDLNETDRLLSGSRVGRVRALDRLDEFQLDAHDGDESAWAELRSQMRQLCHPSILPTDGALLRWKRSGEPTMRRQVWPDEKPLVIPSDYASQVNQYAEPTLRLWSADGTRYSDDETTGALTLGDEVSVATVGNLPTSAVKWVITATGSGCTGPRLRLLADDYSDVEGSARQLWLKNVDLDPGDVVTVDFGTRTAKLADGTHLGGAMRRTSLVNGPGWFDLRPHDDDRASGQEDNLLGFYVDSGTATANIVYRDAYA